MKRMYKVNYSFYLSEYIDIEADTEQEAIEKVEKMLENAEIGNLLEMDIGEQKVWVD